MLLTIPYEYFRPWQYQLVSTIVGLICAFMCMILSNKRLIKGNHNNILPFVFVIVLIFYIGRRPISSFVDTWLYTLMFNLVQSGEWHELPPTEPFWSWIEDIFINLGTASDWLLCIAAFYIGGMALATYRWLPRHYMIGLIFCFTSFSFYTFATNGIRNGMATSIAMVAISLIDTKNKSTTSTLIAIGLFVIAIQTHTSLVLTFGAAIVAFFMKGTKLSFRIWIACLILGFLFNGFFLLFFSWASEDERMIKYATSNNLEYTKTYFRWDFVTYSALPIVVGYIATIKKKVSDGKYTFLLNTYIITNAIWLLICEINFSNRFAYLSWFLYPVVVAYPLCKFNMFKNQGAILGMVLIGLMVLTIIL